MFILICLLSILFIPSIAEAWGPLTHVYLGNQVLNLGISVVPVGIYTLIKKFKDDFLYGNLSADIILGKRFQGLEKNSHNWSIAWRLLGAAKTDPQRAFAYGYLTHLSADTVIHNLKKTSLPFTPLERKPRLFASANQTSLMSGIKKYIARPIRKNISKGSSYLTGFTHSFLEVKSDSIVDKKYKKMVKGLDKIMQNRNDVFLEDMLESVFFSFKTNKRIFKSFLFLSRLHNYTPVFNFIDNRFPYEIPVVDIYSFQQESLNRMFELLKNGKNSKVLKKNPLGRYHNRASKSLRQAY